MNGIALFSYIAYITVKSMLYDTSMKKTMNTKFAEAI